MVELNQTTLLIIGVIGFLFRDKIMEILGQKKLNPPTIQRDRFKVLEEKIDSMKYDDSGVKKSISAINMNMKRLFKASNYLNDQVTVLDKRTRKKQVKEPIIKSKRIPPQRPKVVIPEEVRKEIIEAYTTGNFSIRELARRQGVKKHIVEKCLEGVDKEKIRERTTYIG